MIKLDELELYELVALKQELEEEIKVRTNVIKSGIQVEHGYQGKLREFLAKREAVVKSIDLIFDEIHDGITDGYSFAEDLFEREGAKASVDDDGNPMIEVAKTHIDPFDNHLFKASNHGIPFGSYMGIVGESNSGKSDIVYMMISGFLNSEYKVHLHSYELGHNALWRTLSSTQRNKLRGAVDGESRRKMLSIDTQSYELEDLLRVMNLRILDGCRIFILDSLTQVMINGENNRVEEVSNALRRMAHSDANLIIVVIGQKSKHDIENDIYLIYGSVQVQHHFDILLFVELQNRYDREASQRILWLEKNREEKKRGVISGYDDDLFSLTFITESDGNKAHNLNYKRKEKRDEKETQNAERGAKRAEGTWLDRL